MVTGWLIINMIRQNRGGIKELISLLSERYWLVGWVVGVMLYVRV